ncbi:MAG: phosphoribosylglycinamide formyltransferase [Rhodospirillales bacterium]|jgi:phosphoribosylglycinamide formyltransferase-1|nr:phosphoribosylglycinamide formyltransferase [Rhodospirillales bacterium]
MARLKPRLKVGVLASGRGSNLAALIEAAADPAYPAEIALVVVNVKGAPALQRAEAAGIPTKLIEHRAFPDRKAFDAALDAALREAGIELVCLAGFMRLLTPGFVEAWRDRMINIHPSLLPAFPGLDTHARALAAGAKFAGCTVHFVRHETDTGPIIAQAAVPVLAQDTPDSLAARVLEAEHRIYPLALKLVAEGRVRVVEERAEILGASGVAARGAAPVLLNPPEEA